MFTEDVLGLSKAQAVTASADSEDVYDSGGDGVLAGAQMLAWVGAAFATATSVQLQLQSSTDNGTWVVHSQSPAVLIASLTAGAGFANLRCPSNIRRYVKARYVVGGSNATTGTVYCYIVPGDGGVDSSFAPATIAAA